MAPLRKGNRIRLKSDPRRRGRVESADVNWPMVGMMCVEWQSGRRTWIFPDELELDPDTPLRGRNVVLEHAATDWMDSL